MTNSALAVSILVLAVLLVLVQPNYRREIPAGDPYAGMPIRSKVKRNAATNLTSSQARERLQSLLGSRDSRLASFSGVEEIAKRLSDEDLAVMIDEARWAGRLGFGPWIRCALFAEWGRRDPASAIAFLQDPPETMRPDLRDKQDKDYHSLTPWPGAQSWYSLFRGWGEVDPDAALARLQEQDLKSKHWATRATEEIFRNFVRRDGAAAWDAMTENVPRYGALLGLFRGARDPAVRRELVDRWIRETNEAAGEVFLNLEIVKEEASDFRTNVPTTEDWRGVMFDIYDINARSDYIALVTGALSQDDLEAALVWRNETFMKDRPETWGSESREVRSWAELNVDEAVQMLDGELFNAADLIHGIIAGDPTRAPELINRIDESQRPGLLEQVFEAAAEGRESDRYLPSPDSHTVQTNDPRNYDALLEAIRISGLNEEEESGLTLSLGAAFDVPQTPEEQAR